MKNKMQKKFCVSRNGFFHKIAFLLVALFLSACATRPLPVSPNYFFLEGDRIQGGMILGQAPAGSQVSLDGQALKLSPEGDFVFGFDRDAASGAMLQVVFPGGQFWQRELRVAARDYDIQYVNGVDKEIQSKEKSEETWKRIELETNLVTDARAVHHDQLFFRQAFKWPLIGPITGVFGSQRVYNGEPGRPHYGVDIAAPVGTEVFAPADGIVTLANDDMYYSGGTLILDHGYGISSTLMHLDRVLVKVGDLVRQGDPVARVGNSGRSSGAHLDWRMNWHERRIDPALIVPPMKTDKKQGKKRQ